MKRKRKTRPLLLAALIALLALTVLSGCGDDEGEFTSEGTTIDPILFDSVPFSYEGQVGTVVGASFYKALTKTDGNHTISVTKITDDVDLIVHGAGGFSDDNPLCVSIGVGNVDEGCVGNVQGGVISIRVKLIGDEGTKYTLQVLLGGSS